MVVKYVNPKKNADIYQKENSIKAAVLTGPNKKVQLQNIPIPIVQNGEVLIRMLYSEVCGTDVHIQQGKLAGVPYPIIPGHFAVGVVEQVQGDVHSVTNKPVHPGDTVSFLDVHGTCHRCWQCQVDKAPTKCTSRRVYGVTHSLEEGLLGGWAEKILLQRDVLITHLPENVSPLRFIAGGCGMPTAVHAIERGRVALGDHVFIQGAGPVGLCAAIVAHHSGGIVTIVDKSPVRLKAARALGFDVLQLQPSGLSSEQIPSRKADVVIEATGSPNAITDGIKLARDGGRYVVVGHYSDAGEINLNPHLDINKKHLEILGTWGIEYIHFHKSIELLARKDLTPSGVEIEEVITSIYDLCDVQKALDDVRNRQVVKAVISNKQEIQ